ncbi:MAG TPA: MoaD/ThiS family protein [Egicoccus sp.]|nr:MoaD/ThiS family protein [Egicoccus sp.]HSK21584.1 MoaD/ThiS family protein [Egicoccus sp.]
MIVEVVLRGTLVGQVPLLPDGNGPVELADGATLETLRQRLELPAAPYIAVVDGTAVRGATPLRAGARVELHPPMAGG